MALRDNCQIRAQNRNLVAQVEQLEETLLTMSSHESRRVHQLEEQLKSVNEYVSSLEAECGMMEAELANRRRPVAKDSDKAEQISRLLKQAHDSLTRQSIVSPRPSPPTAPSLDGVQGTPTGGSLAAPGTHPSLPGPLPGDRGKATGALLTAPGRVRRRMACLSLFAFLLCFLARRFFAFKPQFTAAATGIQG